MRLQAITAKVKSAAATGRRRSLHLDGYASGCKKGPGQFQKSMTPGSWSNIYTFGFFNVYLKESGGDVYLKATIKLGAGITLGPKKISKKGQCFSKCSAVNAGLKSFKPKGTGMSVKQWNDFRKISVDKVIMPKIGCRL